MWTKQTIADGVELWTRIIDGGEAGVAPEDFSTGQFTFAFNWADGRVDLQVRSRVYFDTPEEAMLACDQAIERYGVRS